MSYTDKHHRVRIFYYAGSWKYSIEYYHTITHRWKTLVFGDTYHNRPEDAVIAGRNFALDITSS